MRNNKEWSRLDNVAKIFPPTSTKRDTKVFRFICELSEPVDADVLQQALNRTVQQFPLYRSILKKGLFWYYFEESSISPKVMEEADPPCLPIYDADRHGLLFRVLYYKTRINLEVYHALADGTGALQFLRTLVFYYLTTKHSIDEQHGVEDADTSTEEKRLDAFYQYYDKGQKIPNERKYKAYRIRGKHFDDNFLGITEGFFSAKAVLDKAHEHEATMSEFLIALFICSIYEGMAVRERSRPVVITVPVDLRRLFPARTVCNFFGVIHVAHYFKKDGDSFCDILNNVKRSFREQLTEENLLGFINRYSVIENNMFIKPIPLQLKIPCLKLAGWWAEREDTAAFSNLGRISMPPKISPHIVLFDVFVSTKRPQICLCSFEDTLALSFSSPLASTDLQRRFFRKLTTMGIKVEIVSNLEQILGKETTYVTL